MRVLKMRFLAFLAAGFYLLLMPALAAEISVVQNEIVISGMIAEGDAERFTSVIDQRQFPRGTMVRLISPGGLVVEAVAIGQALRDHGFETYVPDGYCYSSCALIWLGGSKQFRHPKSQIGFHQAYDPKTKRPQANALLGFYLAKLGYEIKTSLFITEAGPESFILLTDANAREAGVNFETTDLDSQRRVDLPDGGYYFGQLRDGQPHGTGTKHFTNGNIYAGEWRNGLRHEKGKLTFRNGDVYEGVFDSDAISGVGRLTFADGGNYQGEFLKGEFVQGTMNYEDGSSYEGAWRNGEPNGGGTFRYRNGNKYSGGWKNGRRHGGGLFTYADGSEYFGVWVDGLKSGKGNFRVGSANTQVTYRSGLVVSRE